VLQYFVEKCSAYRMIFIVGWWCQFIQLESFNHLWLYTKNFIALGENQMFLFLGDDVKGAFCFILFLCMEGIYI
jgi:hypothetical protein